MSYEAVSWVKALTIPKAGEKLVMMLLADRISNDTGECYPGQVLLAEEGSMSERSVRKHLAALEDAKFIVRRQRRGVDGFRTSDCYSFPGFMEWRVNAAISAREHHKKAKAELRKGTSPADLGGSHRNERVNLTGNHVPGNLKENLKENYQTFVHHSFDAASERPESINACDMIEVIPGNPYMDKIASPVGNPNVSPDASPEQQPSFAVATLEICKEGEKFVDSYPDDSECFLEPEELEEVTPEPKTEKEPKAKRKAPEKLNHNTDAEFAKFWAKYPKKVGKAGTYTHWKRFQKESPELAVLLPEAALEYESDLRRQHKNSSEAKQMTCCGYNWFNKGLHEFYVEQVKIRNTPQPVEKTESIYEQRAREERERIERVTAACSGEKRAKFIEFLAKVYADVKDAWNEKVMDYFHARKYWDIDALIPIDVRNEARAAIGAPLLAA